MKNSDRLCLGEAMGNKEQSKLMGVIFSVCLVVPFSIDIFLSSLPAMKVHFRNVNTGLVLSVFLFGFALSQPIYGPLLDRYGRRPVLLSGLSLYVLASGILLLVNSFSLLLIARFIQAIGACSAVIAVPAIARDIYHKDKLVHAISMIMALIGISPILAPFLGGILTYFFNWRATFVFLFLMGIFYTTMIFLFLKETISEKNYHALAPKSIFKTYFTLAKQPSFIRPSLIGGISSSIMFSYFALSSLFLIQQMHISIVFYGFLVACNTFPIFLMSFMTPRLSKKINLSNLMQIGLFVIVIGGLILYEAQKNLFVFVLAMFIVMMGIGLIRPSASTSALSAANKNIAGYASAFFNFCVFISGSIASTLTSHFISNSSFFGCYICFTGIVGFIIFWSLSPFAIEVASS